MITTLITILIGFFIFQAMLMIIYVMYLYRKDYNFEINYEIFLQETKKAKGIGNKIITYYAGFYIISANWLWEKIKNGN